ncbi:alpha/beta fold hydrolase [Brevibacterium spongiae]|uniref:Alpha/beta hydrolase n=1 Tax=Brevibacterium spongiae TaxID=2909672 RepID=A0ABY5SWL7_9MICO|nr:alpha/beta fold hydrolase [Brevibacterium spongiae]UVI37486.1 alpha/beta hydrolase [Brevibacterium spongiae]
MALYEIEFTSHNDRDTIFGWLHTPTTEPHAVVHIIHGLGEHSRRYLHLITALLDAGFAVVADDHSGHGRTAMQSGIWVDAGDEAARVVVADELTLQRKAREILPDLPYVVFGHSWGSMIARVMASDPASRLDGLALCGVAAQMRGIDQTIDRDELAEAATGDRRAEPAAEHLVGQLFDGFIERFGPDAGPTAWVALDDDVVADHGRDPFNNFGAPMSARFLQGFVDVYDAANADDWYQTIPTGLPVLILAGDQDPVANYGEGAYHVANRLRTTGHSDVRTRVFTGVRHEVHNEPTTRDEAEAETVDFATRVTARQ